MSSHGACIELTVGIRHAVIAGMSYKVWGCPHLIAAVELACESLGDQPIAHLEKFDTADITQKLSVPTEKAGRILLLEDALAMLWAQYAGERP